jgi:hypothetical protein
MLPSRLATGVPLSGGVFLRGDQLCTGGAKERSRRAKRLNIRKSRSLGLQRGVQPDVPNRDTPCTFDMRVTLSGISRSRSESRAQPRDPAHQRGRSEGDDDRRDADGEDAGESEQSKLDHGT